MESDRNDIEFEYDLKEGIGQIIKEIRTNNQLTQDQLGQLCGVQKAQSRITFKGEYYSPLMYFIKEVPCFRHGKYFGTSAMYG